MKPIHHWRWRYPSYLLTCGAKNGLINIQHNEPVTCKSCLKIAKARGWKIDANGRSVV